MTAVALTDNAPTALIGVDAGATRSTAIAVTPDGRELGRCDGPGANPKRCGLGVAADRIAALVTSAAGRRSLGLVLVAAAGIDRPEHARALQAALEARLPGPRIIVVNDTLAALRAGTPDAVGLVVPVSTGGNVIGRAADGRVTDRGHGIFGGGYALAALAARAVRIGLVTRLAPPRRVDPDLAREIAAAALAWSGRRPAAEVALLGAAVVRAAERGDPYPSRMVRRWLVRITLAAAEETARLELGGSPTVIVYGGLLAVSPWLEQQVRQAVLDGVPGARIVQLTREPADGAAALALDAWAGAPIAWDFVPRR